LSIKPLTVFVVLWDVVGGRWKAWLSVVVTTAALYGLMFLDQPLFTEYHRFLDSTAFQQIMDEHTVGIYNNATVSVAFRLFTDKTLFVPILVFPPLAYLLTFAVPTAAWLATFSAWREFERSAVSRKVRNGCGFALLLPTVLLTTPRVADYTLVWLLVPLFFETWRAMEEKKPSVFLIYILAAIVGNLTITGGQLDADTMELHWLHFRYVSLVLFWLAAFVSARQTARITVSRKA